MYDIMLLCLAVNLYHEARGEIDEGQRAVIYVTLNRSLGMDKDVCSAVSEDRQFSWTNGKMTPVERNGVKGFVFDKSIIPPKTPEWRTILAKAKSVLSQYRPETSPYGTWTHYHEESIHPDWMKGPGMQFVGKIGRHLFYRDARYMNEIAEVKQRIKEENERRNSPLWMPAYMEAKK